MKGAVAPSAPASDDSRKSAAVATAPSHFESETHA